MESEDTNIVFLKTVDITGKKFTDQTGRFPVTSTEPLKTRSGLDLTTAYKKIHIFLTNRGLIPHLHMLENECLNVLKNFMREINEKFQLVPPHIHHINSAERAIRTFKEHFISGLYSTHKDIPLHQWCRLLPHSSLTVSHSTYSDNIT